MNSNYGEGIRSLKDSVQDLKQIQEDIKNNDQGRIAVDWQKTLIDLGKAYANLPDLKNDPHVKNKARAYESFREAAINPSNAHHIAALSDNIQKLIKELDAENHDSLPEWKD